MNLILMRAINRRSRENIPFRELLRLMESLSLVRGVAHIFFFLLKKKLIKTSICDCLEMMVLHQHYQLKLARCPYDCLSKDAIIISNNNKIGTETQDHTEMKLFFIILQIPYTIRLLVIFQLSKKKKSVKIVSPFFSTRLTFCGIEKKQRREKQKKTTQFFSEGLPVW